MHPAYADRLISFGLSAALHLAAFAAGGRLLLIPPQYGVEAGYGGIEIQLVAALPRAGGEPGPRVPASAGSKQQAPEDPETMAPPRQAKPAAQAPQAGTAGAARTSKAAGDGSSPVPGSDPTTLYSPGGARSKSSLRQLRNPAPPYPVRARQLGQQGKVLLRVRVDKSGIPSLVEIRESSGFPLLDDSAASTIRRWRFLPARIGPVATESTVEIPVNFVLHDWNNVETN